MSLFCLWILIRAGLKWGVSDQYAFNPSPKTNFKYYDSKMVIDSNMNHIWI